MAVAAFGLYSPHCIAGEQRLTSAIEVTADAEVEAPADVSLLDFGVFTEASSAADAARDNGARMERVLAAMRKTLGDKARIQTGTYTLQPTYTTPRDGTVPRITGYRASNVIQVRTGELTRVGDIIDAAIQSGANQVQRIAFDLSDKTAPHREALRSATLKARADAEAIAAALALKIGAVQSVVVQNIGEARPLIRQAMVARSEAAGTPVEPAVIRVQARVVLTVMIKEAQ